MKKISKLALSPTHHFKALFDDRLDNFQIQSLVGRFHNDFLGDVHLQRKIAFSQDVLRLGIVDPRRCHNVTAQSAVVMMVVLVPLVVIGIFFFVLLVESFVDNSSIVGTCRLSHNRAKNLKSIIERVLI